MKIVIKKALREVPRVIGLDSNLSETIVRIKSAFERLPSQGSISVMPDFFVDRFVRIETLDGLITAMKAKSAEGGGGSVRGIRQSEVKGGNAVNLGYSLGMMGAKVTLVAMANSAPSDMLRSTFSSLPNVQLNIIDGRPGLTIAFEFRERDRQVNVMVSDVGDLGTFDGSAITQEQWTSIGRSRITAVVNWASNRFGNQLCERVYSFARQKQAKTFFDPADITNQKDLLLAFKKNILDRGLVDFMSLNDNEIRVISRVLCPHSLPQDYSNDDLKHVVIEVADATGSRVDLHTQRLSLSCFSRDLSFSRCHRVIPRTVTGAGDVWGAADMIGYLTDLDAEDRISLSNAAAGFYVSGESAIPPTREEAIEFLSSNELV